MASRIEISAIWKGIRAHLVKDTVEAYRRKIKGTDTYGDDSSACDEPPTGTQLDETTILANDQAATTTLTPTQRAHCVPSSARLYLGLA